MTSHAVPGPSRQFTATSFGDTTGSVGVEVAGGGEVLVGRGVCVDVEVGSDSVGERVTVSVGVSVTGTFDGKLQPIIAKTRARVDNKPRDFIAFLLYFNQSYLSMIPLAIDHLDSVLCKIFQLFSLLLAECFRSFEGTCITIQKFYSWITSTLAS
jgi:hypothetical protein